MAQGGSSDSRRLVSPNKGFELVRELLQIEGLGDTASSGRAKEKREVSSAAT